MQNGGLLKWSQSTLTTHPPFTSLLPLHPSLHHILLPASMPSISALFFLHCFSPPFLFFLPAISHYTRFLLSIILHLIYSPLPSLYSWHLLLLAPTSPLTPSSSPFLTPSYLCLLSPPSFSQLAVYSQSVIWERRSQAPGRRSTPPPSLSTRT